MTFYTPMNPNTQKLFAEFRAETPDYDERHIEVYVQWLADRIDDLQERAERVEKALDDIYVIVRHARTMLENAHAVEKIIDITKAAHDAKDGDA